MQSAATARRELGEAKSVIAFNERHLVGTRVRFWKGAKEGQPSGEACTTGPATILGGTGVVWLDGVSGCIALSHVEVIGAGGGGEIVSLLDKALEAKVPQRQKKGASTEELQLAAAFLRGHVSAHQCMAALGQKAENAAGFVNGWALKAMRAGLADGRITLTIEDPEEDDFAEQHEKVKADLDKKPAAAVRAVSR